MSDEINEMMDGEYVSPFTQDEATKGKVAAVLYLYNNAYAEFEVKKHCNPGIANMVEYFAEQVYEEIDTADEMMQMQENQQ